MNSRLTQGRRAGMTVTRTSTSFTCGCGCRITTNHWPLECQRCHKHHESAEAVARGGGFALIATLVALIVLTSLSIVGLNGAMTEVRVSNANTRAMQAFYAADGGVERALAEFTDPKLATGDSIVSDDYAVPGGVTYKVVTRRVDGNPYGDGIYSLRADAETKNRWALASVELLVAVGRDPRSIPVPAPVTAPAGITKHGNSGILSGYDAGNCDSDSLPGIVVGDSVVSSGDSLWIEGNPPILVSLEPVMTWEEVLEIEPTHFIDMNDYWSWPESGAFAADPWPVVFVNNDVNLSPSESGRGVLIVDGDLTTSGSWSWEGLILVAEGWTSNGNNTLDGAILVGLDDPTKGIDLGNGNKTLRYNSCSLQQARRAAGRKTKQVLSWRQLF